jgi:hypothetical protein
MSIDIYKNKCISSLNLILEMKSHTFKGVNAIKINELQQIRVWYSYGFRNVLGLNKFTCDYSIALNLKYFF